MKMRRVSLSHPTKSVGTVVSSPSGIRGRAAAENGFSVISAAVGNTFFTCVLKSGGLQYFQSKMWGNDTSHPRKLRL